jgi:multicomponent Na+:H+ antiporter subunit E
VRRWLLPAVEVLLLSAFWMVLTDQYDPLFLGMGAVAAVAVTAVTVPFVRSVLGPDPEVLSVTGWLVRGWWFVAYLGWMLSRILVASSQIAWFVLQRQMPFTPSWVRFRTDLERPFSRVVLANSITLVPGSMTVHLEGDEYLVHSLFPASTDDLATGRMQTIVARMCGEPPQGPAVLRIEPIDALEAGDGDGGRDPGAGGAGS